MNVAIVGSGIVGQATGKGLFMKGNNVTFYDINEEKLKHLRDEGYNATNNLDNTLQNSEIIFVSVPTPTIQGHIELKYIKDVTRKIATTLKKIKEYTVVTYRSTIPPQTTRTKLIPLLEKNSNLVCGKDFGVCMNPEFLREKTPLEDFLNPNRVVVGSFDEKSASPLRMLYRSFSCPTIFTDLDTAEMIKYTSNTFLAAKISFFNEIFLFSKKLGLDPKIISEAVELDPRIGGYGVDGGKPFGGMCLPKDLAAFIHFAQSKRFNPKVLKAVSIVNEEISRYNATKNEIDIDLRQHANAPLIPIQR